MSTPAASAPLGTARFRSAAPERSSPVPEARSPGESGAERRGLLIALVLGTVLVAGQWGRGLVTMDDLREAEVALEMDLGGDFLIPHLAGRPFVEKPPGFPALVTLAYRAAGAPSAGAGRAVSAFFAGAALLATYLLGARTRGRRTGLVAASLVGLSPLFCRVSHEILLDNALLASVAFAQLFLWESVNDETLRERRAASWAAGLSLGLSFLFKGLVGPALVGAGVLLEGVLSRSWRGVRSWMQPRAAVAFLGVALVWFVPFALEGDRSLLQSFLVDNHLGRFTQAFDGHALPWHFYLLTLPYKLGWASFLLVPAALAALRRQASPAADRFFLALGAGPLFLLLLSSGKEAIYLLPAYPALALLGASWLDAAVREDRTSGLVASRALLIGASLGSLAMAGLSLLLAPASLWAIAAAASIALGVALPVLIFRLRRGSEALPAAGLLWGLACLLSVGGPFADREDARQEWRPVVERVLEEAGPAESVLFRPTDEFRGALGFFRGRPPYEVRSARELVDRLARSPDAVVVDSSEGVGQLGELARSGALPGLTLSECLRLPYRGKTVIVWRAAPAESLED